MINGSEAKISTGTNDFRYSTGPFSFTKKKKRKKNWQNADKLLTTVFDL